MPPVPPVVAPAELCGTFSPSPCCPCRCSPSSPRPRSRAAARAGGSAEVLTGSDLVPGLADALAATFA
ncbi:hypothetical protein ABZ366_16910 [Streptomyces sp. NPDC005904]|uniref:hypothetical protein n=1 Tax=Streptomyces sp. NPDC005904 TaxID=3154570 RepID=UPI0033E428B2